MPLSEMEGTKTAHAPGKQGIGTLSAKLGNIHMSSKASTGDGEMVKYMHSLFSGSEFGSQHAHLMAQQSYIIPATGDLKPLATLGVHTHVHSNTGK